jgi:hypothetical protein
MNRRLYIKKLLREAVGVPSNLMEVAYVIYDKLIDILPSFDTSDEDAQYKTVYLDEPIFLGDMEIDSVEFRFDMTLTSQLNEVMVLGWNMTSTSTVSDTKVRKISHTGRIRIGIGLAGPNNKIISTDDIVDLVERYKVESISSISHELGHIYNDFKSEFVNVKKLSQYGALQSINFNIPPINQFLHYLYFITEIENIVRPGEIYSQMKQNNVTKKDFYDSLIGTKTFKELKNIQNFSYENFREDLKNHMGRIEEIFDQVNIDYSNMSEDEKIDKILRVLLYNIINKTMEKISDNYITPVESIFGVSEEKDKIMNSLMKNAKRFVNDPEKYYLYQQKNMRRISRNVIQKISKIYSLLESKKNSITNWDAYLKYYVGKTPIDTEVKTYHKKRI